MKATLPRFQASPQMYEFIFFLTVIVLSPCLGCSQEGISAQKQPNDAIIESESTNRTSKISVDNLKSVAVAIYSTRTDQDSVKTNLLGSGFFVSKTIDGHQRVFLVSAFHVIKLIFLDSACLSYEFAIPHIAGELPARLGPFDKDSLHWVNAPENDLSVCDFTHYLPYARMCYGRVMAIDLDPVRCLSEPKAQILSDVGFLSSSDCGTAGIFYGTPALAVGVDKEKKLTEGTCGKTLFALREGNLQDLTSWATLHYEGHSSKTGTTSCVTRFLMGIHSKMSGGAVYVKGTDGRFYLYGVIIGYNYITKAEMYAIPMDKVVKLIDERYGKAKGNPKELADKETR